MRLSGIHYYFFFFIFVCVWHKMCQTSPIQVKIILGLGDLSVDIQCRLANGSERQKKRGKEGTQVIRSHGS